jgi:hypothetical protein
LKAGREVAATIRLAWAPVLVAVVASYGLRAAGVHGWPNWLAAGAAAFVLLKRRIRRLPAAALECAGEAGRYDHARAEDVSGRDCICIVRDEDCRPAARPGSQVRGGGR